MHCRVYCEAVLLLRHCLHPSVVENLDSKEWLERLAHDGYVVMSHSEAGRPTASFALSSADAAFFETYFTKIRPCFVEVTTGEESSLFFINKRGHPIRNLRGEMKRLHKHYKVRTISSVDVRGVLRLQAEALPEEQRKQLQNYLGTRDEAQTPDEAVAVTHSLQSLAGSPIGNRAGRMLEQHSEGQQQELASQADLGTFFVYFPVTLDGKAPSKKERRQAGFPTERQLYDKWRASQLKLREQHLLCQSPCLPYHNQIVCWAYDRIIFILFLFCVAQFQNKAIRCAFDD